MAMVTLGTTTTTTTTITTPLLSKSADDTTEPDYGYEAPLNFMDVNRTFAITLMFFQMAAALVGTFGNVLILVAVASHRMLRGAESVFVVNLAVYDLCITLFIQPLSVLAKVVGWRHFEGISWACRCIGYLCTVSCVGSCLTLTVMSLNRHVLICHHTLYPSLFSLRKCLLYACAVFLFGVFLFLLNFANVGDHDFDYKSYECVWDRMADHDYTIFFSIVLVWGPMTITGIAYAKMYWFVYQSRKNVGKGFFSKGSNRNRISGLAKDTGAILAAERTEEEELDDDMGDDGVRQFSSNSNIDDSSADSQLPLRIPSVSCSVNGTSRSPAGEPSCGVYEAASGKLPSSGGAGAVATALNRSSSLASMSGTETTVPDGKSGANGGSACGGGGGGRFRSVSFSGLKLARPLFIIYVVFASSWLPYSLGVAIDRYDVFPHEFHAFITAFAHANSSVNWVVYYITHKKIRQAFLSLLQCRNGKVSNANSAITALSLKTNSRGV